MLNVVRKRAWRVLYILCVSYLVLRAGTPHLRASEGGARLAKLVASLRYLEKPPPLKGMVRCTEKQGAAGRYAAEKTKFHARFFRRGGDVRVDYLRDGFDGRLSAISNDDVYSALVARNGAVTMEAGRGGIGLIDIYVYRFPNGQSRSASARFAVDLGTPLSLHFAVGNDAITDFLQLATANVDYHADGGRRIKITADKTAPGAAAHHFAIELDPRRGNCATYISDAFEQDGTGYSVVLEIDSSEVADGVFAVNEVRQMEHLAGTVDTSPFRTTVWNFSELQLGEIDDAVFSLEALKQLAPEAMVIDVSPDGDRSVREHVATRTGDEVEASDRSTRKLSIPTTVWIGATIIALFAILWFAVSRRTQARSIPGDKL